MKKKMFSGSRTDVDSLNECILQLDIGALNEIPDEYLELAIGSLLGQTNAEVGVNACTQLSCTGYFPRD